MALRTTAAARRVVNVLPPVAVAFVLLGLWWLAVRIWQPQPYIFPSPGRVWDSLWDQSDRLWTGFVNTLYAAVVGFVFATLVGVFAAIVLSLSPIVERAFFPWAVLLQTVPAVAVAPLFVLWFGPGRQSVMLVAFTITLFPILANALAGLRSADAALVDLIRLRGRGRNSWFTFSKIRIPSALPFIFTGLRISAGLAVIGAIVGEIVVGRGGPEAGLGYWITFGITQLRTDFVFAAIGVSSALGISFFLVVTGVSQRVLRGWHESARQREL